MKIEEELPNKVSIFPLSNFIIFPRTTVPLNIFEPRYIQMIDDSMKSSRIIGLIQPKKSSTQPEPELYNIGCLGKITSFNETEDGRYLIVLNGIRRFKIIKEIKSDKLYRECEVSFNDFKNDTDYIDEEIKFTDLRLIFKNLKTLFKKKGYTINWKELEKNNLDQIINTLSIASPFTLEEKQALLETQNLNLRKNKLEEILKTYVLGDYINTTIQ